MGLLTLGVLFLFRGNFYFLCFDMTPASQRLFEQAGNLGHNGIMKQ